MNQVIDGDGMVTVAPPARWFAHRAFARCYTYSTSSSSGVTLVFAQTTPLPRTVRYTAKPDTRFCVWGVPENIIALQRAMRGGRCAWQHAIEQLRVHNRRPVVSELQFSPLGAHERRCQSDPCPCGACTPEWLGNDRFNHHCCSKRLCDLEIFTI